MFFEEKIEELSRSLTLLTGDVQLLTAALKPILEHLAANREAENESSTPVSGSQSEPEQTKGGLTHEEYQQPEPETSPYTYDDVKRATNNLSAAKGKEVTIAALAHFGVTRATQLTEAQWEDYIMYCGART